MTKARNDRHCWVQKGRTIILILAYKGKYDIPASGPIVNSGDHFYFDLFTIFEMLLFLMSPVSSILLHGFIWASLQWLTVRYRDKFRPQDLVTG